MMTTKISAVLTMALNIGHFGDGVWHAAAYIYTSTFFYRFISTIMLA